jgi:hypothetical protein
MGATLTRSENDLTEARLSPRWDNPRPAPPALTPVTCPVPPGGGHADRGRRAAARSTAAAAPAPAEAPSGQRGKDRKEAQA